MSTGKRLAKRSILGTRVVAPGDDGKFYPGIIQAMKTCEDRLSENKYSVRFEETRRVREFRESEIIGPGFQTVTSSKLRAGQVVYITYQNREVQGAVLHHRPNLDQVHIQLLSGGPEVVKKLEDVRLLESRKSARLIGHGNTDFSKLADFNIVHERKRLNSETASDISYSGGGSGRKRRGSETFSDSSGDEFAWSSGSESPTPVMSECTAALVLMNLSHSPAIKLANNNQVDTSGVPAPAAEVSVGEHVEEVSPAEEGSPASSGVSSLGSSWTSSQNLTVEAEALLQLSNQESDEGIVSDQSSSADSEGVEGAKRIRTEHVRIVYQCTWKGCNVQADVCSEIERHIRRTHLGRADPETEEDNDHEEEFYYTEIEVPLRATPADLRTAIQFATPPILVDHMDMVRPPHENPEYYQPPTAPRLVHHPAVRNGFRSPVKAFAPVSAMPIAIPVTNFTAFTPQQSTSSPSSGKYIRLSPKPSPSGQSPKSPIRRPRGDAKKCRKVYGMEHRDLWCTQCKWKKACTRFGDANAAAAAPAAVTATS